MLLPLPQRCCIWLHQLGRPKQLCCVQCKRLKSFGPVDSCIDCCKDQAPFRQAGRCSLQQGGHQLHVVNAVRAHCPGTLPNQTWTAPLTALCSPVHAPLWALLVGFAADSDKKRFSIRGIGRGGLLVQSHQDCAVYLIGGFLMMTVAT